MDLERHNPFALPRNELTRRFLTSKPIRSVGRAVVPTSRRERVESVFLTSTDRPAMEPEARRLLEDAFADDTERLQAILGRELPW